MKNAEAHGSHLTPDEIILRVFPVHEEPAPMPMHLALCGECQAKVARVRDGLLLDRGAVAGAADVLPEVFWAAQSAAVMHAIREEAAPNASGIHYFPIPRSFVRRPFLAFASLAAALTLVAGMSILNPFRAATDAPSSGSTASVALPRTTASPAVNSVDSSDDELLRSVDSLLLEETPYSNLIPLGVS